MATAVGHVYPYGAAGYYGSPAARGLRLRNVVALAPVPSDGGYWVLTASGSVYAYGSAVDAGSLSPRQVRGTAAVALAPTLTGNGYWILTANGRVWPFGAASRLDADAAHRFKGARWCLLKNPENLNDDQAVTLRRLRRRGPLWRANSLKEARRAIFAGDLDVDDVAGLLDRFCAKAQRSGLRSFVTLAKTIRQRRAGSLAAVRLGINNAQHEGLNRRVRLIINRAYGFHSAKAALALVMLTIVARHSR